MLDTAEPPVGRRRQSRPLTPARRPAVTDPGCVACRSAHRSCRTRWRALGEPRIAARRPRTYRLQLHAGFALRPTPPSIVPYLADLGVSHLYLSPILQAAPGSHARLRRRRPRARLPTTLGGAGRLGRPGRHAPMQHGLGVVVRRRAQPHGASPTPAYLNRPLWDVLRHGPTAPDGAAGSTSTGTLCDGRLGLPLLGDTARRRSWRPMS
ncbi:MAG: hypothetical protein WKF83_12420 [Nocardioidaceae bacterium]